MADPLMTRFFRYSMERDRAIRLILIEDDGKISQVNAVVLRYDAQRISLYIIRPPRNITIPLSQVLSASYAPKDEGEG